MSIKHHPDPLEDLPPELAELDQELSQLVLDERPSFGPELRNELAREWTRPSAQARSGVWMRPALAASVALLAFTGLVVPPARASLVEGVQRIFETLRGEEATPEPASPSALSPERAAVPRTDPGVVVVTSGGEAVTTEEAGIDLPPFQPGTSAFPTLLDKEADRQLVRRYYPEELQRAGVRGVVKLQLWVDEDGSVDHIQMSQGSGVGALDRAALRAAPELRFKPAMRAGVPVGTWVEFDLVFEPVPSLVTLAEPGALETPMIPEVDGWEPPRDWSEAAVVPAPILMESQELLRVAMGRDRRALEDELGPLEGVLSGDPPPGIDPVRWRERATRALEAARVRDPGNPAPYLALARIRRKQGLRNDAQMLFEEGLARAASADRPVSPRLVAELAYESGRVVRENWLGWRNLGEVPAPALLPGRCAGSAGSPGEVASSETLLTWNYYCPGALHEVFGAAFQPRAEGNRLRSTMLESFVRAVEAYPAHVGANTEILLDLADREAWHELREGARRFAWASQGHPNALLLEAVALHRLGHSEEAADVFKVALEGLDPDRARGFQTLELLMDGPQAGSPDAVWRALDPILSTAVNERQVEHWARAGYALLRFGSLQADASRVWVRYGRPQEIRAFGAGPGLRLEFWDYGAGPDVTFYRPAASQNGALTVEGEDYVTDLEGVMPHWYGTRARPLFALPAQIAQFRGTREGTTEAKIHFAVPGEFRSASSGSELEVGVFLLSASGVPMETLRWTLEPRQERVDLVVPAGPGVHRLVVELFDPTTGMAAGVRTPVSSPAGGLSELLLVEPAEVDRIDVGRMGQGLRTRPSASRLVGEMAGVFLEIYEMGASETYRLRAELVSAENGAVVPLEMRPAGQSLFGEEWTRRPLRAGTAPEFMTLDLRGVGPGAFTLRVLVERGDGHVVYRELAGLDRVAPEADEDGPAPPLERVEF
jgi:TonB family protein